MNRTKQMDIVRKKNAELSKQLDDIKFQLEFNSQLNMNGYNKAKDLIVELESIKQDWLKSLNDLNNQKEKYSDLVNDLHEIKKIMISRKFKIPWYRKLINKLKRAINKSK